MKRFTVEMRSSAVAVCTCEVEAMTEEEAIERAREFGKWEFQCNEDEGGQFVEYEAHDKGDA